VWAETAPCCRTAPGDPVRTYARQTAQILSLIAADLKGVTSTIDRHRLGPESAGTRPRLHAVTHCSTGCCWDVALAAVRLHAQQNRHVRLAVDSIEIKRELRIPLAVGSFEIQPQCYLKQVARSQQRRGIGVLFIHFFVLSHTAKGSWHRSYLARGGGLTASLAGFPTCKNQVSSDGDFHRRYPILLHRFQFKRSRYTCPLRAPSISDQSYPYINVDITWATSSTQLYSHHDSSMMDHNLADSAEHMCELLDTLVSLVLDAGDISSTGRMIRQCWPFHAAASST